MSGLTQSGRGASLVPAAWVLAPAAPGPWRAVSGTWRRVRAFTPHFQIQYKFTRPRSTAHENKTKGKATHFAEKHLHASSYPPYSNPIPPQPHRSTLILPTPIRPTAQLTYARSTLTLLPLSSAGIDRKRKRAMYAHARRGARLRHAKRWSSSPLVVELPLSSRATP